MIMNMDGRIKRLRKRPRRSDILLVGGFGFVGSELIHQLDGYDIAVAENCMSGTPLYTAPFYYVDIRNKEVLRTILPLFDTIVHLAAVVGEPSCAINPDVAYQINVVGTENIVSSLYPEQKLIFISSSSVYGDVDSSIVVTEDTKPNPLNNYARHKLLAEQIVKTHSKHIILRPVTAFGVSDRIRLDLLVNTFIFEALHNGYIEVFEPYLIRPMIHVQDFAAIIKFAIDDHLAWNEIYNIGDPSLTMHKIDLARIIAKLCNAKVHNIHGSSLDLRNYYIDFEKILESGYKFTLKNPLALAVQQIQARLSIINANPENFNTPLLFRNYLSKGKENVYEKNNM